MGKFDHTAECPAQFIVGPAFASQIETQARFDPGHTGEAKTGLENFAVCGGGFDSVNGIVPAEMEGFSLFKSSLEHFDKLSGFFAGDGLARYDAPPLFIPVDPETLLRVLSVGMVQQVNNDFGFIGRSMPVV